jgi:hypothetical protein
MPIHKRTYKITSTNTNESTWPPHPQTIPGANPIMPILTFKVEVNYLFDKTLYILQECKSPYKTLSQDEKEQLRNKIIQIIEKNLHEVYNEQLTYTNDGVIEIQ